MIPAKLFDIFQLDIPLLDNFLIFCFSAVITSVYICSIDIMDKRREMEFFIRFQQS